MKRFLSFILALATVLTLSLSFVGCGDENTDGTDASTGDAAAEGMKAIKKEDLFVGFIFVGEKNDIGFTYAHNQAREMLEADGIKTTMLENIAETKSAVTEAANQLISAGCNVIYANSFGHGEFLYDIAKENPDVYFGHATGYMTGDNFSNFMGRVYEARYLSGIVAGLNTKTNKIGYVAAKPIAEVYRGINAFALGVKSVNPDATIEVVWTDTWYDTTLEKQAAEALIAKGCDVMAQHCDSTAPQLAAQEAGIKAIGYNCPTAKYTENTYLTAPIFHWDVFYKEDINNIINGTWEPQTYWEGLKNGMVSLDTITDVCENKSEVEAKVKEAQDKIISGELVIFQGPLTDNKGTVHFEGTAMTDADLTSSDFNWLLDNVIGS